MTETKNGICDVGRGGVERVKDGWTSEFINFFEFIRTDPMPEFWVEYDRGVNSIDDAAEGLAQHHSCEVLKCREMIDLAVSLQQEIPQTKALIQDLKQAGYRLYVLSNMSKEFIEFIRGLEVYQCFDGEVVSCEEQVVKPEPEIYNLLMERYGLDPYESLFVDDREVNLTTAETLGIGCFHFTDKDESVRILRDILEV